EVRGRGLSGHVRIRREDDLLDAVALDAPEQFVDPEVRRIDPVEWRERAAEHVVEAAELRRPLDRDQVARLLDDADQRTVAPRVEADRADLVLRQVPALAAEADARLHLLDRLRQRECLVRRRTQEVEREALRRPCPDAGQTRQLRDEVVDRRGQHTVSLVLTLDDGSAAGEEKAAAAEAEQLVPAEVLARRRRHAEAAVGEAVEDPQLAVPDPALDDLSASRRQSTVPHARVKPPW